MLSGCGKYLAPVTAGALITVLAATTAGATPQAGARLGSGQRQGAVAMSTVPCGGFRWSVKTGTDPDARLIDLGSVTPASISSLTALPAPRTLPPNNRLRPTETTVFRLSATLDEYALIRDDSDYHLILTDKAGDTLLAEIPHPACVGGSSPLKSAIATTRARFDASYRPTTTLQAANVPVVVTGVGFFDVPHGQAGAAPNSIELHPVLDIRFRTAPGGHPATGSAH